MNELVKINNDGQMVVSSKDIAEHFEKEHKNVIQSVENLVAENSAAKSMFFKATFDNRGKQYPMYLMNRDGFSLLVMGFTGKSALEWKIKYIEAFNKMEQQLRSKPLTPAEQLLENAKIMVEHERRISLVEKKYDCIGNSIYELSKPTPSGDTWQADTLHQIRQLCAENNLNYQQFITDLYKELEESAGVNLETRQKRKRERLELQGAKYAERQAVSKLSIIAEDRKLREILSGIVQNHAAALVVAKMPTA